MRAWRLGIAASGLIGGIVWLAAGWPAARAQEPAVVSWRDDVEAARAEARRSGKPLFVVFR